MKYIFPTRIAVLTVIMLSCIVSVYAQASLKVIPPRNVIAGQNFHIIYRLTNGEGTSLNAPAVNGCKLLTPRPGMSTMQSVQIINGQQSSSTTIDYTFTYRAEKMVLSLSPPHRLTLTVKRSARRRLRSRFCLRIKRTSPATGWLQQPDVDIRRIRRRRGIAPGNIQE